VEGKILKRDVGVAKNYLKENEFAKLSRNFMTAIIAGRLIYFKRR